MKGAVPLTACQNEMPAMSQRMYMDIPTGGVIRPIIRFNTITTPKCTGSIPAFTIIG